MTSPLRARLAAVLTPTLLVGLVAGVVLWGGFNTAMEATNSLEFCTSCHEMRDNPFKEYEASVHYRNAAGVRAICSDCHVPKDWTHKLIRKAQATNELLAKLTGAIDTPEKFEARRLDLARHEWARMKASDSRECRNCHSFEAMDHGKQTQKGAAMMSKAAKGGWTCIDCHKGIAHKLPDLGRRYRAQFDDLAQKASAQSFAAGDPAIAFRAARLWIDGPAAPADSSDGEIAPGAEVRVLETRDDWLRVEIRGWRREGFDEIIYATQGKRITQATLEPAAVARVETLREAVDPDTEQPWRESRLAAWTPKAALTKDAAALAAYAGEMHEAACAFCHDLHPAQKLTANDWIGAMNAMKRMTPLKDDEARLVLRRLQGGASDAR